MLCKVKEETIVDYLGEKILLFEANQVGHNRGYNTMYSSTFKGDMGNYRIIATGNSSDTSQGGTLKAKITLGSNTNEDNLRPSTTRYANFDFERDIKKSTNDSENLIIQIYSYYSYSDDYTRFTNCYIQPTTMLMPGTTGAITGKPRSLKAISQKATTTIFGFHTDNTRITQDVE